MNQARSIFSHTVIEALFPDVQVFSAGVEVKSSHPNLPGTAAFLSELGLGSSQPQSAAVAQFKGQEFDLILVAEDWMKAQLTEVQGEVLSYEELVDSPDFMPSDPVGLSPQKFKVELAKVFWISLRSMLRSGNPRITAVIPEHESLIPKAVNFARQFVLKSDALLIDAELTVPYTLELKKLGVMSTHEQEWDPQVVQRDMALHFQATPSSLSFVMHSDFFKRLDEIAEKRPVVLITAPLHSLSGPLAEPFFTSATAGDIRIIRRF